MKRILFIAPHSFPIHSSESICNAKVAYLLTEIGYAVDVITIDDGASYPNTEDTQIFLKNNTCLSVYSVIDKRSKNRFLSHIKSVLVHLLAFLKTGYYYKGVNFSYLALNKAQDLICKNGIDSYVAMISRGYRTEVAALFLKKKYGIRWIANWNDPYPIEKFPAPYGEGIHASLTTSMNRILDDIQRYADIHTFPSSRLRDYMMKYMTNVRVENTRVIPHLAHSILSPQKKDNSSDILVLVHAGNVTHPRNPTFFLQALSNYIHSVESPKVLCYFIGKVPSDFNTVTEDLDIVDYVKYLPPQNYFNTLQYIRKSDVSVIIEAACEEGIYLPTKVVDSFQCGKPIFCVSPTIGTLRDLNNNMRVGYCADNDNVDSITKAIFSMCNDFQNDNLPVITKDKVDYFFEDSVGKQYLHMLRNER